MMEDSKRLIDATIIYNGIALYMAENAYLNDTPLDVLKMVAKWINEAPTLDAVEMPKGKPGDYVKWDSGVREWLWEIKAVVICKDCIRYDLGGLCPVVKHRNIRGILSREEAEEELTKMDGDGK